MGRTAASRSPPCRPPPPADRPARRSSTRSAARRACSPPRRRGGPARGNRGARVFVGGVSGWWLQWRRSARTRGQRHEKSQESHRPGVGWGHAAQRGGIVSGAQEHERVSRATAGGRPRLYLKGREALADHVARALVASSVVARRLGRFDPADARPNVRPHRSEAPKSDEGAMAHTHV